MDREGGEARGLVALYPEFGVGAPLPAFRAQEAKGREKDGEEPTLPLRALFRVTWAPRHPAKPIAHLGLIAHFSGGRGAREAAVFPRLGGKGSVCSLRR